MCASHWACTKPRGTMKVKAVRTVGSGRIRGLETACGALPAREVEGMSYDEISDVLQCPRGTVMSRLHYARTHLRTILKDVGGN